MRAPAAHLLCCLLLALLGGAASAAPTSVVVLDGREAAADRVLVRWKDGITPPASLTAALAKRAPKRPGTALRALAGITLTEKRYPKLPGVTLLRFSSPGARAAGDPAAAAAALKRRMETLRASGLFAYVEPDYRVHATLTPDDAAYADGTLWGLRNTGRNGGVAGFDIDAPAAWDLTTGSSAVVVAVIDTGVRYTHRDLAANLWRNPGEIPGNGRDDDGNGYVDDVHGINAITGSGNPRDDHGHGTHVAGTIGAVANGGGAHVGVAWNVRLMALKFLDAQGSGYDSDAIECIDYAIAKGARILSNSWGGDGFSAATRDAIDRARRADVLFVAAAGNDGRNTDVQPTYPAGYALPNVVSVGAVDRGGARASFSNHGASSVDLAAPGVDIYSTTADSDTSHGRMSGTSMATPHVSGVAALVLARHPDIGVGELKQRLLVGTTPLASFARASVSGGMLNARRALRVAADGVLEVAAEIPLQPLRPAQSATVVATVTDLAPVTGAAVNARFDGGATVSLRDDGIAPDTRAEDGIHAGRLTVPTGRGQVTLEVTANRPGGLATTTRVAYDIATPPANDDFAARAALPGGSTRATGSTRFATGEALEPRQPAVAGGHSVWWHWIAPSDGEVTIDTQGSDFDTTLAVYTGASLGELDLVDANDDAGNLQSAVSFTARAGMDYVLQVDGFLDSQGSVVLNFPPAGSAAGAPRIDTEPTDQLVLPGEALRLEVVVSGDELNYQWYKDGAALPGANAAVYTRDIATTADAGAYRVRVENAAGMAQSRIARVRVGAALANDAFADAAQLQGDGRVTGSTAGASGETDEPDHAAVSAPLASAWYHWTAPADGVLRLSTAGSDFDTTLAVYTGSRLAQLTVLAANDDAKSGTHSQLERAVRAGVTYRIAVDGFNDAEGDFKLAYRFVPAAVAVPNDDFARAAPFRGRRVTGSNVAATGEAGEPDHGGRATPLASAWWAWVAPRHGRVVFDTAGSDFDTTLGVYTGERVDQLREIAADDDANGDASRVEFLAEAGRRYFLAVDGYGEARGRIVLNRRPPPERPDLFVRSGSAIGRNRFLPERQVVTSGLRRGEARLIPVVVQNAGSAPHHYRLTLSGSGALDRLSTSFVTSSGAAVRQQQRGELITPLLRPGQFVTYVLRVQAARGLPADFHYQATLRAADMADPRAVDQIRLQFVPP